MPVFTTVIICGMYLFVGALTVFLAGVVTAEIIRFLDWLFALAKERYRQWKEKRSFGGWG